MDGNFFDIVLVKWDQAPFTEGSNTERPELNDAAYNTGNAMAESKSFGSELLNGVGGDGDIKVPFTRYSPEKIFSGAVPAFDVNFIDPKDWSETLTDTEKQEIKDAQEVIDNEDSTDEEKAEAEETIKKAEAKNNKSIATILHDTIAKWYVALRNLAIVGMLIILLYVGIRIIISSTASDKAKYKEFLKDWLIALCLLFTLHYIMTFTVTVVNSVTEAIAGGNPGKGTNNIPVIVVEGDAEAAKGATADSAKFKFNTDIMGYARFLIQYDDLGTKVLYFIIYMAMVIYTVMFTITYLKRSLTMAFLTMIAPLIALTYPIDKIGDGSAQGFNSWLKEYVYNALIQPFHLIIYTVFAGSAVVDLSAENPIYAIIVLAFISQSEKMLRKFFGFDKASSAGSLGSFAGGAAAMSLTQKLIGSVAHRKKGGSGGSGGNSKIRTQNAGSIEDNNSPGLSDFADSRIAGAGSSGTIGDSDSNARFGGPVILGGGSSSPSGGSRAIGGQNGGVHLEPGETISGGIILPAGVSNSTSQSSQPAIRTAQVSDSGSSNNTRQRSWTQDDTRGMGQWISQNLAQSNHPVMRFSRGVGNVANSIKNAPGALANKVANSGVVQNIPKPIRNSVRGAGAVLADIGKKGLHAAPRVAGRAALGALGASVGIAAGIAGDDLNDIVKFGAAGAGIGSTLGYDAATGVGSSIAENARDTYNVGAHGLNAAELADQRRTLMKDKDRMNRLNDLVPTDDGHARTAKEKKELLAKSIDYTEAGITDERKIAKAMKLEKTVAKDLQNVEGMTEQEKSDAIKKRAMIAAQFAERVDDKKLVDEKYVEQVTQSWARGMLNPEGGINQAQARREAENMMKYVKKLKKVN